MKEHFLFLTFYYQQQKRKVLCLLTGFGVLTKKRISQFLAAEFYSRKHPWEKIDLRWLI